MFTLTMPRCFRSSVVAQTTHPARRADWRATAGRTKEEVKADILQVVWERNGLASARWKE